MFKLMKLEIQKQGKHTLVKELFTIACIMLACLGIVLLVNNMASIASSVTSMIDSDMQADMDELLQNQIGIVNALVGISFIIFGAVNYARYIVKGLQTKEIQDMFLYPISRVALICAKITLAFLITTVGFILAKTSIIYILSLMGLCDSLTLSIFLQTIFDGVIVSFIAMGALLVGIMKKSSIATVVSGTVLALFLYGNIGSITLATIPYLMYVVAGIMFIFIVMFIRQINRQDSLN